MRRLNNSLQKKGVDSKILSVAKGVKSKTVSLAIPNKLERKINSFFKPLTTRWGLDDPLNLNSRAIKRHPDFKTADIINFHRLPGVLSYLSLPSLTQEKPCVYTICDMWAFTGHCRYSLDCTRWKSGCGKCPYPDVAPKIDRDLTHIQWMLKKWVYSRSTLAIVVKSKWTANLVKDSILNNFPIYHIPNGIDIETYRPRDTSAFRAEFRIPKDKKVLMFGAQRLDDFFKGGDLLVQSLQRLPEKIRENTMLLTFGRNQNEISNSLNMPVVHLGYIESDAKKAEAYSTADLLLHPSRAEMFGNVTLESIACGTPVISFKGTGSSDTVRPNETGYLAEPENPDDFCHGIISLLDDKQRYAEMQKQCRKITVKEYSLEQLAQRYYDLYSHLLGT